MEEKKSTAKNYGRILTVIIAATVVLVGAVMGVRYALSLKHDKVDNKVRVSTSAPQVQDLKVYTKQVGTVMPGEYAAVIPLLQGEILEVNFNIGDEVREGDVLAVIKCDSLESLQLQVDAAKIQLDDALTSLERIKQLYAAGAVSQQTLEQTQSGAEAARLSYEGAVKGYDLQRQYANVTAPISGTIESKNVSVHDFAAPSNPICIISASGDTQVTFGVTDESAEVLKPGDTVSVEASGRNYEGKITEVSAMLSAGGLHNCKAVITGGGDIPSGSRVIVELLKKKAENVMTIPMSAVYRSGTNTYVYVYQADTAVRTDVKTGIFDEEFIEVEGLNQEDQVITFWNGELFDGAEVVLIQ